MPKSHILDEIRRTAAENGGEPLGRKRFEAETGIRYTDWFGVHWACWGDALLEAGFEPNRMQVAYNDQEVLRRYAELALELGRIPVRGDLQIKRREDASFPSYGVFTRLGTKDVLLRKLAEYCGSTPGFEKVVDWCERPSPVPEPLPDGDAAASFEAGYVYMIQHGRRREYKIGRTNNVLRREGEIALELPQKARPIHVIRTDDPAGIESYWHRRFADRRMNGDWFELSTADVAAFRRRKFM